MKTIRVTDFGIVPSAENSCSEALTKLIAACGDDCEIVFPEGIYFLTTRIQVRGHRNLTLRGENATFRVHFCNTDLTGLDGAFHFEDCRNLTLDHLVFDTDVSPNIAGAVSRIDREAGFFDVRFFDEFPLTGRERLEAINTVDPEYTPDYRFVTYEPVPHTYLGDNTFRFDAAEAGADLSRLYEGLLVNVRHCSYGPALATFCNVETAMIRDITITAASGCVFVVFPRCSDFTFLRYRIALPEGTRRLMAANADGIHLLGLTGTFVMEDCYFEDLGDDALNIHSKACMVTALEDDRHMTCQGVRTLSVRDPATHMANGGKPVYELAYFPMGDNWTRPGDRMYVYDHETVRQKGLLKVTAFEGTAMEFEILEGTVWEGDILANAEYYAATQIRGCTIRNTRARGLLLQTDNVVVENCHIYGMSLSAILLSPDIDYWYEVGPCTNVVIRNNLIEKCACCVHRSNMGAIIVKCRHEEGITDSPAGVHKHIAITGNTFRNIGDSAVFALAVRDLQIRDNRFEDCCNLPFDDTMDCLRYDIALVNCDEVAVSDNTSTQPDARRLHCRNVNLITE